MSETADTSRYYGVQVHSNRKDGQKSYRAYFTTLTTWPPAVLEQCQNKKNINIGTFNSEIEAASAVDQIHYILFSDQPDGCPRPPNLPQLLTPTICAALANKIVEWAAIIEGERKKNATSKYKGVFRLSSVSFRAQLYHPITNKFKGVCDPDEASCARIYDRQMLKWWGSGIIFKLNFPIESYLDDDDDEVAQLAKQITEGGEPNGEYGHFKDRAKLRAAYRAGTLDPNQAFTSAAATTAAAAPARRQRRAASAAPRAAPSNPATGPAFVSTESDLDEAVYESEDNSDDEYESEYDSEEDAEFHLCNMDLCYDLLPNEDEMDVSEWLQSQGISYPFPRNVEGGAAGEDELPDDPHGVFEHLAGPDWATPPQHPEALKLWRSEIKLASENFENDVFNIMELLREKNDGHDPENYKVNGQYPDTHVHWLVSKEYIDAEGNTLRKVPRFDQWVKEADEKWEKEIADRKAAAEAGVPYVPPPKPVVPEGFTPFYSEPYFHLPPGLDKFYLPRGQHALTSLTAFHACKAKREIDRKIRQYQNVEGFCGPDGQLSLEKIGEAFKLLGEQCIEAIHEMFQQDDLRDWFIVNSSALYKMCGDAVSFIPQVEEQTAQPESEENPADAQFPTIGGDAEDWEKLFNLTAQLEAATSKLNVPVQKTTQAQQEHPEAASDGTGADMNILLQQKCAAVITPDLLSSARLRLAELQAQEQNQAQPVSVDLNPEKVDKDGDCHLGDAPPVPEIQQLPQEEQQQQQKKVIEIDMSAIDKTVFTDFDFDYDIFLQSIGGEENLKDFLAETVAGLAAYGLHLEPSFINVPPTAAEPGADATSENVPMETQAQGTDTENPEEGLVGEEEEVEEEDFVQRWEHVAPGYAEYMKIAEKDGWYDLIDSKILGRQQQAVAEGSDAVCKALKVERSIDQALKDLVHRKECEEWNWKVGLALQQNLTHWLTHLLGEDWRSIIDAHPDGVLFGEHPLLRVPDLEDPLDINGIYDDHEEYTDAGMNRLQVYETFWKEAQVDSEGPALIFLDSLYTYWEPVILAYPLFCGAPIKPEIIPFSSITPSSSPSSSGGRKPAQSAAATGAAASKEKQNVPPSSSSQCVGVVKLVPEKELTEDDLAFIAESQLKIARAGKKRRKDTVYLSF